MRISVVFPEPDGPTSAVMEPRGTVNVAFSTMRADAPFIETAGSWFVEVSIPLFSLPGASVASVVNKQRGRPRGGSDARENIIQAAKELFAEFGYKGTTLRRIAAEAGIDHSLVNYYFGTKENLFSEAVLGGFSPSAIFKAVKAVPGISLATLPRILSRTFVAFCETSNFQNNVIPTLKFALEDDEARQLVTGYMEREIFEEAEKLYLELRSRSSRPMGASAHEAVIGVSTVLLGALVSRYILRTDPHATMSSHEFRSVTERLLKGALS